MKCTDKDCDGKCHICTYVSLYDYEIAVTDEFWFRLKNANLIEECSIDEANIECYLPCNSKVTYARTVKHDDRQLPPLLALAMLDCSDCQPSGWCSMHTPDMFTLEEEWNFSKMNANEQAQQILDNIQRNKKKRDETVIGNGDPRTRGME